MRVPLPAGLNIAFSKLWGHAPFQESKWAGKWIGQWAWKNLKL